MINNRKFQGFKMFLLMRNIHFLMSEDEGKNILSHNYFSVAIVVSTVFFLFIVLRLTQKALELPLQFFVCDQDLTHFLDTFLKLLLARHVAHGTAYAR